MHNRFLRHYSLRDRLSLAKPMRHRHKRSFDRRRTSPNGIRHMISPKGRNQIRNFPNAMPDSDRFVDCHWYIEWRHLRNRPEERGHLGWKSISKSWDHSHIGRFRPSSIFRIDRLRRHCRRIAVFHSYSRSVPEDHQVFRFPGCQQRHLNRMSKPTSKRSIMLFYS